MNAPLYTTEILRLATSLSEPKPLAREDGRAEARSPTCGSRIVTAVQLDDEGRVEALSHPKWDTPSKIAPEIEKLPDGSYEAEGFIDGCMSDKYISVVTRATSCALYMS